MPNYGQWTPSWWKPETTVPSASWTPQVEFLDAVNKTMPYVSPLDQQRWGQYLYAAQPKVFNYGPDVTSAWQPTYTPEQQRTFDSPERHQAARNMLFGQGTTQGLLDLDSPVRQWLDVATGAAKEWAPGGARVPGARRTRGQQSEYEKYMSELLGQPQSYGVTQEQSALWKPWLESYLAPTTSRLSGQIGVNAPEWMLRSSVLGPKSQVKRGNVWGNNRWL